MKSDTLQRFLVSDIFLNLVKNKNSYFNSVIELQYNRV